MPLLRFLGYLWAAPLSLIGLLLAMMEAPRAWEGWSRGALWVLCDYPVLTMGRRLVARTMGWVVIQYHPVTGPTEDHELHHVKQCMLWGPFIIIAYPLASLWAYLKGGDAYSDNWFEKAARRAAGQEV